MGTYIKTPDKIKNYADFSVLDGNKMSNATAIFNGRDLMLPNTVYDWYTIKNSWSPFERITLQDMFPNIEAGKTYTLVCDEITTNNATGGAAGEITIINPDTMASTDRIMGYGANTNNYKTLLPFEMTEEKLGYILRIFSSGRYANYEGYTIWKNLRLVEGSYNTLEEAPPFIPYGDLIDVENNIKTPDKIKNYADFSNLNGITYANITAIFNGRDLILPNGTYNWGPWSSDLNLTFRDLFPEITENDIGKTYTLVFDDLISTLGIDNWYGVQGRIQMRERSTDSNAVTMCNYGSYWDNFEPNKRPLLPFILTESILNSDFPLIYGNSTTTEGYTIWKNLRLVEGNYTTLGDAPPFVKYGDLTEIETHIKYGDNLLMIGDE